MQGFVWIVHHEFACLLDALGEPRAGIGGTCGRAMGPRRLQGGRVHQAGELVQGCRKVPAHGGGDAHRPDRGEDYEYHDVADQNAGDPVPCGFHIQGGAVALQNGKVEGDRDLPAGIGNALAARRYPGAEPSDGADHE